MPRQKKQRLKRRKDGRFACRYKDRWFMADTEEEALEAREAYKQAEKESRLFRPVTVSEYIDRWLPLHKHTVSDKCYNDYLKQLKNLEPVMGDKLLTEVTVDDAATVWMHYDGYSQSTIKRARMLYISLFDSAVENDLCRKNPFRGKFAQPPKAPSGTHRTLTEEEIRLILTTPHRFQLATLIMLYAGLRRGEVLALTAEDIDTTAGIIRVTKAVRFDGNAPVITSPKTESGKREVPILSTLRPFLSGISGIIAPMTNGKIMTSTGFSRAWQSYIHALSDAAGEAVTIRPHDLRHTYCTMLRDAGVDMHQAMVWMGHADEKMIIRVYDHVGEQRTQNSVEQVEKMLIGRQNGRQDDIEHR